jgi:hypothetical protein
MTLDLAHAVVRYGEHDQGCPAVSLEDPRCTCGLLVFVKQAKAK